MRVSVGDNVLQPQLAVELHTRPCMPNALALGRLGDQVPLSWQESINQTFRGMRASRGLAPSTPPGSNMHIFPYIYGVDMEQNYGIL